MGNICHTPLLPPPHCLPLKYQWFSQTKSFAIGFSVSNSRRKLQANVAQNLSTFRVLRPNIRPVAMHHSARAHATPCPLLPYCIYLFTDRWPQEKICDMSLLHTPNAYPFLHTCRFFPTFKMAHFAGISEGKLWKIFPGKKMGGKPWNKLITFANPILSLLSLWSVLYPLINVAE